MRFDLVIFDIDGVFVDVSQSYREAIKRTVEKINGKKISNQAIEEIKKQPGSNNDWDVSFALAYAIELGKIDRKSKKYQDLKAVFQDFYIGQKLYENEPLLISPNTLQSLKDCGIKIGVVTSRPRKEAMLVLKRLGMEFFDPLLVVAQEDCTYEKPNPEPLLMVKRNSGAVSALYVGDTINDQLAAKAAGMIFISVVKTLKGDYNMKSDEIVNLVGKERIAEITRSTSETKISARLNLDGSGTYEISTGIGFFDHMLSAVAKHGLFDLTVDAKGDLEIEPHHTVEDTGIVLGQLFKEALGDKRGITRYGFFMLPMDEAMATAAVDFDGRGTLVFDAAFSSEKLGEFGTQFVEEFFMAFVREARCSLHLKVYGKNDHHKIEALFKAFTRAVRMACEYDPRQKDIPSTKGVI